MTPAARVAAAADILDRRRAGDERAEALIRRWGRENRFAGSKDRRAISDIVYDCLRRLRSYGWLADGEDGRALVLGRALALGGDPRADFSGVGHALSALSKAEARRVAFVGDDPEAALAGAPDGVRLDFPDWLSDRLRASLGADFETALQALQARAPVDLRVNRLRADPETARAAIAAHDPSLSPETVTEAPDALRLPPGARLAGARALDDGLVELQDAASQAGAALAAPAAGERILDYCAGGGGKALAFASLTGGRARIAAHDVAPQRMRDLPARARRAWADIEIVEPEDLPALEGACDLVFVDAPCSGSG
ncbi:MAG: RsmB/NOP family class I SAM-dependent RNA methyltransferase, partial [Pseudomonadota bacterium]